VSRPAAVRPVETAGTDALGARSELGELRGRPEFESIGVDRIPEAERTSTPWTFFGILVGQSLTMSLLVFGWLAITFGLGVWGALSSLAAGTVVGIALVVPLMLIGSATATNNSTASGAHFGVRGRLVGSIVGLAIMVVYTALGIWGGGQVTVMILARLFGTPESDLMLAIAYAVLAVGAAFIAIYGYHLMARVEFALLVLSVVTFTLIVIAFAGRVDLGYQGGEYVLESFWNTWILSAVVVGLSGPMSLITVMGDWTRYISPSRFPARNLLPVASLATFIALMVPSVLGVLLASAFSDPLADFFTGLVHESPTWTVAAMLPLATAGTIGFVSANMYSAGLDLDAIIPRLSRAVTTLTATAVATVLVFVGSIVWDARDSITAVAFILVAIGTPWAAITGIGYLRCRGRYHLDDLQVFNRRQTGGVYWYANGFNYRAVVAWLAGSLYGCLAIEATPLYTGPLADLAGGVDTSFLGSFVIALVIYLGAERAFPARQPHAG
jgi:purine-cytosine permease-like protein